VLACLTTARLPHFRCIDLPDAIDFAYPAVKVAHDYLALPVWLSGKSLRAAWTARRPG
jgi:hypothetical protein